MHCTIISIEGLEILTDEFLDSVIVLLIRNEGSSPNKIDLKKAAR